MDDFYVLLEPVDSDQHLDGVVTVTGPWSYGQARRVADTWLQFGLTCVVNAYGVIQYTARGG